MDDASAWAFISSCTKMIVTFVMPDGYPHATPVWFVLLNGKIYFRSQKNKRKTTLARSAKVCCVFEEGEKYTEQRGCVLWGACKVLAQEQFVEEIEKRLAEKYGHLRWKPGEVSSRWVEDRAKDRKVYFAVDPIKISSWDNRKIAVRQMGSYENESA